MHQITFDKFAEHIFAYARQHNDLGFIIRLHPAFIINEMLPNGFWSKDDLALLKQYCRESDNIVFDESETYDAAFSVSDAILSDAYCGIICTVLPTLKPICVMYRDRGLGQYNKEITDSYYSAYGKEDLYRFFDMVRLNGEDTMLPLRRAAAKKCIMHFDGKNGERLKDFIDVKYGEEATKRREARG